jgi:tetratricopeptide (TPR) repeat protein
MTNRQRTFILLNLVGIVGLLIGQSGMQRALATASTNLTAQLPAHNFQISDVAYTPKTRSLGQQNLTVTASTKYLSEPIQAHSPIILAGLVSAAVLNNRGLARMNQGDFAAAQALFNQAVQINPSYAPVYNNRAMVHVLMGELDAAIQDYTISLKVSPGNADVYVNRGLAYASADRTAEAIADYTAALQIDSRNAQAYHARGGAYLSLSNRAAARTDFQRACALYRQQGNQQSYAELQDFMGQL